MNLIKIEDINASELDVFIRNTENQLRSYYDSGEGIFVAESAYVIMRAIEAGYEPLSMLVESDRLENEAIPVFETLSLRQLKDAAVKRTKIRFRYVSQIARS